MSDAEQRSAMADVWTDRLATDLGVKTAGCWRCGALSDVLARILSLSGLPAEAVNGTANGEPHVWVQIGDEVYDPTAQQFVPPIAYVPGGVRS